MYNIMLPGQLKLEYLAQASPLTEELSDFIKVIQLNRVGVTIICK